ncbi:MAG: molybdopterin biosynthesis protein, partial [Methanoregulaceae archaeon]|nr:molybdopterin biosynthesis protein [Methanoregulaceae archaeon]
FAAGDEVEVRLTVTAERAASALLVVGSHDPSLDRLAALLSPRHVELHSSHTGSMGGLLALMRKDCHAAPIHLLSPDGSYNTGYLRQYLPGEEIVLLGIAGREQGVVSRDGIGIDDLPGRSFVNRQKGSGTRILLDYELSRRGIDPGTIPGYDRELTTHTAVALAVKSGDADAGVCVFSAAKAFGLEFVPISTERYELAVRKEHRDDPRIRALFSAVDSDEFRETLRSMGGYDTSITGTVREVTGK